MIVEGCRFGRMLRYVRGSSCGTRACAHEHVGITSEDRAWGQTNSIATSLPGEPRASGYLGLFAFAALQIPLKDIACIAIQGGGTALAEVSSDAPTAVESGADLPKPAKTKLLPIRPNLAWIRPNLGRLRQTLMESGPPKLWQIWPQ